MVRNSILIFCLCVCFCQYHISVFLYTHLYTHIINKLLHGRFVCTIFIIHSLWRIAKLTRSLRSLVRLTILHNSWIKIVRTHQPWCNLYLFHLKIHIHASIKKTICQQYAILTKIYMPERRKLECSQNMISWQRILIDTSRIYSLSM